MLCAPSTAQRLIAPARLHRVQMVCDEVWIHEQIHTDSDANKPPDTAAAGKRACVGSPKSAQRNRHHFIADLLPMALLLTLPHYPGTAPLLPSQHHRLEANQTLPVNPNVFVKGCEAHVHHHMRGGL